MPYHTFYEFNRKIMNIKIRGSKKYNCRYYFNISFEASIKTKSAIIIMLNPSSSCKQKLYFNIKTEKICDIDQTTFNVINNLLYSYDDLIILNLYPYYSSNPQDLEIVKEDNRFKKVCLRKNRKFIKKVIKNNNKSDIYCAWGKTKPNSDEEIAFIKKMLLKYDINEVKCKTKSKGQFVFANINSKQFINNIHGLFW